LPLEIKEKNPLRTTLEEGETKASFGLKKERPFFSFLLARYPFKMFAHQKKTPITSYTFAFLWF
jgi:hypothetical protein